MVANGGLNEYEVRLSFVTDVDELASQIDVTALIDDLARPMMVYRFARAKSDAFPGARAARERAAREVQRVVALHALGRADVLREELRLRILARAETRRRSR